MELQQTEGQELQTFTAAFTFAISRRVPWSSSADLECHLAQVVAHLQPADGVVGVRLKGATPGEQLNIEIILEAADHAEASERARLSLAAAIRESGASHAGLLPPIEEARVKPKVNAWSGLRVPYWQQRRFEVLPG